MKARLPATWATAIENNDSAAASLTRLSPVRIAITFFGSPSLRPTATAVTASGGATTAPRINAVANVSDGTIHDADTGDGDGGDDDQPDAEAEDRPDVAQERREREVQRRRVQQRRQHHRQQHLGFQFDAFESRCERHRESNDDEDECGFQPAPMRDGSDHDGADDDEDQFHPAIVASIRRRCCVYFWQVGHQNRLRPSSSAVRIVVPHTRHGSPARR